MNEFIIDCLEMHSNEKAHKYLSEKLNFPNYYGNNLDALWDILSTIDIETQITFKNQQRIIEFLPNYGERLVNTFVNASKSNEKLTILFLD